MPSGACGGDAVESPGGAGPCAGSGLVPRPAIRNQPACLVPTPTGGRRTGTHRTAAADDPIRHRSAPRAQQGVGEPQLHAIAQDAGCRTSPSRLRARAAAGRPALDRQLLVPRASASCRGRSLTRARRTAIRCDARAAHPRHTALKVCRLSAAFNTLADEEEFTHRRRQSPPPRTCLAARAYRCQRRANRSCDDVRDSDLGETRKPLKRGLLAEEVGFEPTLA